jgi:catalase
LQEAPKPQKDYHQWVAGHLGRYQRSRTQDDYKQAGERYRTFQDWEREDLISNISGDLKQCPREMALRMVWHFWHADEDYGRRVAEAAGIDLQEALKLPPLPGKPAPHARRDAPAYTDGQPEEPAPAPKARAQRAPAPAK